MHHCTTALRRVEKLCDIQASSWNLRLTHTSTITNQISPAPSTRKNIIAQQQSRGLLHQHLLQLPMNILLQATMLAAITRHSMAFVSRSSFTQTLSPVSRTSTRSYSRTTLNMKLQTAIVGLPNVGKSTLFNALTETQGAEAANYPFCTIEPNTGIVEVPDTRLGVLTKINESVKTVPTTLEFVDVAGLVKGA